MNIQNSVSFGARFLSDDERDVTYDYSEQFNKLDFETKIGSDVRVTKLESTGNYNAHSDYHSQEQNCLLMDEDSRPMDQL